MSIVLFFFMLFAGMWILNIAGGLYLLGNVLNVKQVTNFIILVFVGTVTLCGISLIGYTAWKFTYMIVRSGYHIGSSMFIVLLFTYLFYFIIGGLLFKFVIKNVV